MLSTSLRQGGLMESVHHTAPRIPVRKGNLAIAQKKATHKISCPMTRLIEGLFTFEKRTPWELSSSFPPSLSYTCITSTAIAVIHFSINSTSICRIPPRQPWRGQMKSLVSLAGRGGRDKRTLKKQQQELWRESKVAHVMLSRWLH